MALRYVFPKQPCEARPFNNLSPVYATMGPLQVSHNSDKDVSKTAQEILSCPVSDVSAPVGAGKSTLLPRALARESSRTVYMVVPNQLLATQIYDYVTSEPDFLEDGVASHLCEDPTIKLPDKGVIYLGAATMAALLLHQGPEVILVERILFLDEAHESDAYSFVLRNLGVQLGASHLVRSSATFSLEKVIAPRRMLTIVREGEYEDGETPDTWDLTEKRKPWNVREQLGNTLVFTDSESEASIIATKYKAHGYLAFRLTSKTSVEDFRAAMKASNGIYRTVLIVDYSYRSGFTFNVTNVIDTGRVYFMSGVAGECLKQSRFMYEFESIQAKGRVGRLATGPATYTRASGTLERIRNDLEGVEAEAAAYLYRLLGFEPSLELAGRVMARMCLPNDVKVSDALNEEKPLTCQPLVESVEVKPPEANYLDDPSSKGEETGFVAAEILEALVPDLPAESQAKENPWESLIAGYRTEGDPRLVEGTLYRMTQAGAEVESGSFALFPDGYKSVMRYSDRNHGVDNLWDRLEDDERTYAIAVLLRQYNTVAVEVRMMKEVLRALIDEHKPDPEHFLVNIAVREVAMQVREFEVARRHLFKTMCRFLCYSLELAPINLEPYIVLRRQYWESTLKGKLLNSYQAVRSSYEDSYVSRGDLSAQTSYPKKVVYEPLSVEYRCGGPVMSPQGRTICGLPTKAIRGGSISSGTSTCSSLSVSGVSHTKGLHSGDLRRAGYHAEPG